VLVSRHGGEANGVWWPPRSSKPLFRRGSVERLVRFRHASAIRAPRSAPRAPRSAPRAPRPALRAPRSRLALRAPRSAPRAPRPALRAPRSRLALRALRAADSGARAADLLFRCVGEEPDLRCAAFVRRVHGRDRLIERDLIFGVDEHDFVGVGAAPHLSADQIRQVVR
jgi:hypothetical protein